MAAFGLVRMMRSKPSRADRAARLGRRVFRTIGFTGMQKIPTRYIVGFGSRMLRRMAR